MKTNKKLFEAAEKGDLKKVESIVNPKLFGLLKGTDVENKNGDGWTPLISAAVNCHVDVVNFLIEKKADVNAYSYAGFTALMGASKYGADEIATILVEKKADVNKLTNEGWSALMYASWQGHLKIVDLLLKNGADLQAKSAGKWPSIMWATQEGHHDVVEYLISKGFDPNTKDDNNWSVLHEASCKGNVNTVSLLVENGADINSGDVNNFTPLMAASKFGHPEIAAYLISKGADVNAAKINEDTGWTALIFAAWKAQSSITKILIENDANINATSSDNWNAIMFASREGDLETAELLIKNGAELNLQSNEGFTALLLAANNNNKKIMELLLQKKANVFLRDNENKSALDFARQKGFSNIVNRLIKAEGESFSLWTCYYDQDWNFSFSYPPSWNIVLKNEQAGSWIIPIAIAGMETEHGRPCFIVNTRRGETLQGNSNVTVFNCGVKVPSTVEEYIELNKQSLANEFPDFKFLSGEKIKLANRPASHTIYTYRATKGRIKEEMITWFGVGITIQFICEVPEKQSNLYAPFYKQMLSSFRIGKGIEISNTVENTDGLTPIQHYNKAIELYRNGEFKKSIGILEKCIHFDETHLQALYAKALCQQELGLDVSFADESEENIEKSGPVYISTNLASYLKDKGFQVRISQKDKTSKIITKKGKEQHLIHISCGFGGFFNMAWRMEGNKTIPVNDTSANPNPSNTDKIIIDLVTMATSLPPCEIPEQGFETYSD